MIAALMLALAYWIFGLFFALCGFCALGSVISLFLSVIYAFRAPARLVAAPLWAIFSFASLGGAWLAQWTSTTLGNHTGHDMQYWFIVGAIIPGILGAALVPQLIRLTPKPGKRGVTASRINSAQA
jgi:hypothetical protein